MLSILLISRTFDAFLLGVEASVVVSFAVSAVLLLVVAGVVTGVVVVVPCVVGDGIVIVEVVVVVVVVVFVVDLVDVVVLTLRKEYESDDVRTLCPTSGIPLHNTSLPENLTQRPMHAVSALHCAAQSEVIDLKRD